MADCDPGPETINPVGAGYFTLFVSKLLGPEANPPVSTTSGTEAGRTQITETADSSVIGF